METCSGSSVLYGLADGRMQLGHVKFLVQNLSFTDLGDSVGLEYGMRVFTAYEK